MNGERQAADGERISNGVQQSASSSLPHVGPLKLGKESQNLVAPASDRTSNYPNGDLHQSQPPNGEVVHVANSWEQAPPEILQLIPRDNYLPMAALITRASQSCWNGLSNLVEQLASMNVPEQSSEQTKLLPNGLPNNQTKSNLDKKERLLNFANDQKADFIKLLVLLQWSKDVEDVSKTISINYWLMKRREAYWSAIALMAILKQESSGFQIPNPDLKTAAEVLSRGKVLDFPSLGYLPPRDLSNKQILRLLESLDRSLSVKLALSDDLPPQLQRFRIHDGRATFTVPNEFELDVSILDESLEAPFRMVDFRFSFTPTPHIPDTLHSEIERYANSNIDRDGLRGCYFFLHEMALSYKLAEFHKQALELSRSQWAGNIRVELIRRNLVVQYWSEKQAGKSWIEVGIASGREKKTASDEEPPPFLEIKWMRQGKRVDSLQLRLNDSVICFEDVLRQVIAQDSTHLLDSIYEKLILTPLFAKADLLLEQSLSMEDPQECFLTMQLSHFSELQLKVDSVTGLLVISPATERSERLQYEINRIQGITDEVASKLLNYRCSVMEATVLSGIAGTSWEALRAFRFNQTEVKALFGGPVVRMNMFRQVQWGLNYSLAVTHGQNGDHWWLLQQIPPKGPNPKARYQVLRSQRIEVKEDTTSAYFDRLAEYSTGLICLHRNADFLKEKKSKFDVQPFPAFEKAYELPELSFELPSSQSGQKCIKVRFGGIDRTSNLVTAIAQYQNQASSAALRHLDESILDANVKLNPENRMVTIRVQCPITEAAIPKIVENATDLEKFVSTVEQLHRHPGLKLKTVSKSAFTIIYHQEPPREYGLTMAFGNGNQVPQFDFFPPEDNPHRLLAAQYTKLFMVGNTPFVSKVRDLLTSLTLTLPLLTYLHELQRQHGLHTKDLQPPSSGEKEDRLRVHVLVRSATAFAIQYFTPAGPTPKDVGSESQPHLLARLEILQHVNAAQKPMWLVRAALEEFQSSVRTSNSTPALGAKLRQEIFTRTDGQSKWLALDKAAACMADEPEILLQSMHDLLWNWAKQAKESEVKNDETKGHTETKPANVKNVPNGTSNKPGPPPPKAPGKIQMTNNALSAGGVKQPQRPPNAAARRAPPAKPNQSAAKKQEIITLD